MFTGIVQEVGTIAAVGSTSSGTRMTVVSLQTASQLRRGDSVCVAGVCLTVVEADPGEFAVDLVPETIACTTLGRLKQGSRVNLEAATTPTSALGGHLVQGHVDRTVELLRRHDDGAGSRMRFELPRDLAPYSVSKGSVTLDGVSLTIAAITAETFDIALIPHTVRETTLGELQRGDRVNVEVDVIAKYVERLVGRAIELDVLRRREGPRL